MPFVLYLTILDNFTSLHNMFVSIVKMELDLIQTFPVPEKYFNTSHVRHYQINLYRHIRSAHVHSR